MIKKTLLVLLVALVLALAWFYAVGSGSVGGEAWNSAPVTEGPRISDKAPGGSPQILFGDLHTHTNYSLDAYVFNTELMKGVGVVTPADACDYARYCSALDFWSINDHAESLTPRVWQDTVDAVRACNAQSGEPDNPDMVSFVGWEWSNTNRDDMPSHYGHKNVIFRSWEEGETPVRPISSQPIYMLAKLPAPLLGLISLVEGIKPAADLGWYVKESAGVPVCADNVASDELPGDCREVADTPTDLYRKLDELGFDSMVIPHGLAWGVTNPITADFRNQLDEYESRYQKLIETFSGHGNSERFEDFERIAFNEAGEAYCPAATENFTPCCRQAAEIVRAGCDDPQSAACQDAAETAMNDFAQKGAPAGRKLFPEATLNDWAGCGQLQNSFQPAAMYVPRQSTQYNLALGFDENGQPKRTKFGLIGSSDNHVARPGNSYKEVNRPLSTDNKNVKGEPVFSYNVAGESDAFYYTGGLVAVHTEGRDGDAIWDALDNRQVYATSGDRMLVWFDLLNGPEGEASMGSEVKMSANPRFKVKALGAFEQQPGCPDYAVAALGKERVESLCGGECYRPGDRRKAITRIEIVRIRPQVTPDEAIAPLVEHKWQVFDCPGDGTGCTVEFEDSDYSASARPTLYYARVIQEAEPLIGGDPFGCEYDDAGNCISRTYCIGENAAADNDCTAMAEPRAWSSPIYLELPQ
jgi:Protein of unknown function (DUF3604)